MPHSPCLKRLRLLTLAMSFRCGTTLARVPLLCSVETGTTEEKKPETISRISKISEKIGKSKNFEGFFYCLELPRAPGHQSQKTCGATLNTALGVAEVAALAPLAALATGTAKNHRGPCRWPCSIESDGRPHQWKQQASEIIQAFLESY